MSCRLCRSYGKNNIQIFSEKGKELKICQTIEKHFWFKLDENDCFSSNICEICWGKVVDFDKFYKEVETANELFEVTIKVEPDFVELNQDSDQNPIISDDLPVDTLAPDNVLGLNERIDAGDAEKSEDGNESNDDYEPSANERSDSEHESEPENKKRKIPLKKVAKTGQKRGRKKGSKNRKNKTKDEIQVKEEKNSDEEKSESDEKDKKSYKILSRPERENRDEIIARYMELKCDICGLPLPKFCELKKHMQDEHNSRGYAVCCSKKFLKKFSLVDHVLRHLNPEIFKCQDCNRSFINERTLQAHQFRTHKPDEEKTFECVDCHKKFSSEKILKKHRVIHLERKFNCELCPRRFPTSSHLKSHMNLSHSQNKYMCDNCGKVFAGPQSFKIHLMEHSSDGSKRVQCDICHKWYKNIVLLSNHKRSHQDNVVHECDICGKISASRRALLAHKNYVHSTDRKFECVICKKSFKKALNLREHQTLHTGEILYRCPHCPKTFNSSANMHSHRKKVHPQLFEELRKDRMVNGITEENKVLKYSALTPTLLKSVDE